MADTKLGRTAIFLLLALGVRDGIADDVGKVELRVGLGVFRANATTVVIPEFPPSAFAKKHTGVAVAEVQVSALGGVGRVKILESPDSAIAAAVEGALFKWKFSPFVAGGEARSVRSRVVFYFKDIDSKPVVVEAFADAAGR